MSEPTFSLLLVEDDAIVRGWAGLSLKGSEFCLAGEAASIAKTRDLAERPRPDLLLVDYRLADGVGTDLVWELRRRGVSAPVLLMTANRREGLNEAAREAGAQGTFLKTGKVDELLAALRAVADGEHAFDSRHPRRLPSRAALSPREREVLGLVATGATNREIAATLGVGDETVKTVLARAFAKLGVRSRSEAVAAAHATGLL